MNRTNAFNVHALDAIVKHTLCAPELGRKRNIHILGKSTSFSVDHKEVSHTIR